MSINEWVRACHSLSKSKGWYEGQTDRVRDGLDDNHIDKLKEEHIPEKLCLIHSEVSEALEAYREGDMGFRLGKNGKPEGFDAEIADIVIRCFDLAGALDIDLESAIRMKHEFNETRPHRHGGKRA